MTDVRLNEEEIFQAACDLASEEAREAYLNQVCGNDGQLKERVLTLLRADLQHRDYEDTTECRRNPTKLSDTNKIIGPYKILQEIGKGGMGVVYMAEQFKPVKRRVALKLIKPGLDTDQVVARFEAERQALAMMDHPNIAKVLDAGATEDGRPFFVMELVKGLPITQYCDEHRLNARERLQLYVSVCRGVQHAHMKGVIHRDLKPSNVLIAEYDHQPVTKIIDFGVAKATNQELTDKTMFTQFGQIIGTLDYMSPEQAKFNQLDIDTRSDVYSLGVLLYELLTGETPIEKEQLRQSGLEELLRIIREDEPPRPSTRVGSSATLPHVATNRNTDPKKLIGQLRDDLDWIVAKAIAKERGERYQSAEALASDIDCHLRDMPITARRPSIVSRAKKLLRRKKTTVMMLLGIVLASSMAAALGVNAHLEKLERKRQQAETERAKAETDRVSWAHTALPRIEALFDQQKTVAAYQLASEVGEILKDDAKFEQLWDRVKITPEYPFDIRPAGTTVSYREALDPNAPWVVAGQSPILDITLPRGPLRFRLTNDGYLPREFQRQFPQFLKHDGTIRLEPVDKGRKGMTHIDGVDKADWDRLPMDLRSFYIDSYEVTNREFQAFVDADGYGRQEFWMDLELIDGNQTLTWNQAMDRFVDLTGQHGPATWSDGSFPGGMAEHPVSGVSWFEAMAFAKFAGKHLPTVFHWYWAADCESSQTFITTRLSNFSQQGATPRGDHDGIGRFQVYDMAGNVREWCFNKDHQGRRFIMGGSWNDREYLFVVPDADSPWSRDARNGFRCAMYGENGPEPEFLAAFDLTPKAEKFALPDPKPIEPLLQAYEYDRDLPFNAEMIQADSTDPSPVYRREIIQIDTAYDEERFDLHLLIPRTNIKKFRTVVFYPGIGGFNSKRKSPGQNAGEWANVEMLARMGMIACYPEYMGTHDRHLTNKYQIRYKELPVRFKGERIATFIDLRRTVDYLMTRKDVDGDGLLYYGFSWGAISGPISLAIEPRFKAGILVSGGYWEWETQIAPEIASSQFARHVKQPVLMINGIHDGLFPLRESQLPLYDDFQHRLKDHAVLLHGHVIPADTIRKELEPWLERVFATDQVDSKHEE